jgi:hypothetical protein
LCLPAKPYPVSSLLIPWYKPSILNDGQRSSNVEKVVKHFKDHIIQWVALGVLVVAMFSAARGAALPAIWALGRFVIPMLIIWLVYRVVKSRISKAVQKFQEQMMQGMNAQSGRTPGAGKQVIDLCPRCGSLMSPGHFCKG